MNPIFLLVFCEIRPLPGLAVNQEVGGSNPPAPVGGRGCPARPYGLVGLFSFGPEKTIASGEGQRKDSHSSFSTVYGRQRARTIRLLIKALDRTPIDCYPNLDFAGPFYRRLLPSEATGGPFPWTQTGPLFETSVPVVCGGESFLPLGSWRRVYSLHVSIHAARAPATEASEAVYTLNVGLLGWAQHAPGPPRGGPGGRTAGRRLQARARPVMGSGGWPRGVGPGRGAKTATSERWGWLFSRSGDVRTRTYATGQSI